ncbi:uncharacterized protein [Aristolochia californica]|uniref:uncharacterized protein n=1 Tax=Aristolochia californica TaxID=171875 RepID=UPI0035DA13CF
MRVISHCVIRHAPKLLFHPRFHLQSHLFSASNKIASDRGRLNNFETIPSSASPTPFRFSICAWKTTMAGQCEPSHFVQHVIVMRHGDRIDNAEPLWVANAARPWDPPLTDAGKMRAWCTGKKIRRLNFRISRVFVSPFYRCIQTASEAVAALCAVDDDSKAETSQNAVIDPSKVKVSIEYGLCEVLNTDAIRGGIAPKNGSWNLELSQLETMLPSGTVDHTVELIYNELPKWQEETQEARSRYEKVITALANKFPRENLLFVTHGEGVGVAISSLLKNVFVYDVEYCAYAHSRRQITFGAGQKFVAGNFEVLTGNGMTGICWQEAEPEGQLQ